MLCVNVSPKMFGLPDESSASWYLTSMLPPAGEISWVPSLLQICVGILKIPSKIPVDGPVSTSVKPVDARPPVATLFIVQRLYLTSLIFISNSKLPP